MVTTNIKSSAQNQQKIIWRSFLLSFPSAFKWRQSRKIPCRAVKISLKGHQEHDCYTIEEAQQFLDLLIKEPLFYQAFFTLAIYGGFRRGELCGLECRISILILELSLFVGNLYIPKKKEFSLIQPKRKARRKVLNSQTRLCSFLENTVSNSPSSVWRLEINGSIWTGSLPLGMVSQSIQTLLIASWIISANEQGCAGQSQRYIVSGT